MFTISEEQKTAINIDIWMEAYTRHLETAVRKFPLEYAYPVSEVSIVAQRMREAFLKGSYLNEGRAIKAAAKELGIKSTYKAINAFIYDKKGE